MWGYENLLIRVFIGKVICFFFSSWLYQRIMYLFFLEIYVVEVGWVPYGTLFLKNDDASLIAHPDDVTPVRRHNRHTLSQSEKWNKLASLFHHTTLSIFNSTMKSSLPIFSHLQIVTKWDISTSHWRGYNSIMFQQ